MNLSGTGFDKTVSSKADRMYLRHWEGLVRKVAAGELEVDVLADSAISRDGIAQHVSHPSAYRNKMKARMTRIMEKHEVGILASALWKN